ncbi:MAG TPA: type II secretion system F family protein [archaeon]|nr:type II secretion system F family protein [archaeon]
MKLKDIKLPKFSKTIMIIIVLSGILSVIIVTINFLLFIDQPTIFSSINIIAGLLFVLPILMNYYLDYSKKKEIEQLFPVFLRDFVESVRGGMTLPQAFRSLTRNDYKALTPLVKKIAAQLDWGIPVDKALMSFARGSGSKFITRIISTVIESHRFGGNLAETFEALANTSLEVEKLRQERALYLHSQMITGYIIFFVFLSVIIGLGRFLVPSLSEVSAAGLGTAIGGGSTAALAQEYKTVFRNLIVIQGLFAGLAVGKMAEGATIGGVKHSLFMMIVGIIVFTLVG